MQDLIKEKLKEIFELCELTEEKYQIKPSGFLVDNYLRIKDDIESYNIITAPKIIKLSEILGKLNDNEWKDFQATKQENVISIDNNNCFREYLNIDKNKITDISEEMQIDKFKWLYTLWIAGTEIIDDLRC